MERNAVRTNQKTARNAEHSAIRSAGPSHHVHPILQLERNVGSHRTNLLLRSPYIQTKLNVSSPEDESEREADGVADKVMKMAAPGTSASGPARVKAKQLTSTRPEKNAGAEVEEDDHEPIARKAHAVPLAVRDDDDDESKINAKATESGASNISAKAGTNIRQLQTGGQPLRAASRAFFEPRFAADFSGVRVHTDAQAATTANSINAKAFTVGRHIAFASGHYSPESHEGRRLLAHELTHVMQNNPEPLATEVKKNSNQAPAVTVHTSQHDDGCVRREMDVDAMSIGPQYAQQLTDRELDEDFAHLLQRVRTTSPGTIEHDTAAANLQVIEEEVARRGFKSLARDRDEVMVHLEETTEVVRFLSTSIRRIVTNKYGLNSHDGTDRIVSDAVDQLGSVTQLIVSSQSFLSQSASGSANAASLLQQSRQYAAAASEGAELLRRYFALLQLADMAIQYVQKLSFEYSFVTVLRANGQVNGAIAALLAKQNAPDALEAVNTAITQIEEAFGTYTENVKRLSPEFSFELSTKALEREVATPPQPTSPIPQSPNQSLPPDYNSVQASLSETAVLAKSLVAVLGGLAKNERAVMEGHILRILVARPVDQLERATKLVAAAYSILERAKTAKPTEALALFQEAAAKASAARSAVDLVRMQVMILRLIETAMYHSIRASSEFYIRIVYEYSDLVDVELAKLEKPGADGSSAANAVQKLTQEFFNFKLKLKEIDEDTQKMMVTIAIIQEMENMIMAGAALYSMRTPSVRVPRGVVPPTRLPPTQVVNPRQVVPGQIGVVFGKGTAGAVPVVDQMVTNLQQLTAQEATNLRNLYNVANSQGINAVPNLNTLRPSVQLFLRTPTNHPFYQARFGTAVQHMTEDSLATGGVQAQFGLVFRRKAAGGIPDVQMRLPNGNRAIFDWTTPRQVGKISKYNATDVDFLIEVVQPGAGP